MDNKVSLTDGGVSTLAVEWIEISGISKLGGIAKGLHPRGGVD